MPLLGDELASAETHTDAWTQQRVALESTLCVPVEASNSCQLTSAVQAHEVFMNLDELHLFRFVAGK